MKIEGTHELRAERGLVWQSLVDPEVLRRCIPGCERLERTGEDTYAATLSAGVGAIKGVFQGDVRLEEMREPEHYRIVVDAKGRAGFLKGAGDFDLEEREGVTTIRYAGDVQVGGTLASVGQRMLQGAAKMLANQFFKKLEAEAQSRQGDTPTEEDSSD
jgi:carbon monoxide dehydrogenase subunit G